jgi:hypothetical protein
MARLRRTVEDYPADNYANPRQERPGIACRVGVAAARQMKGHTGQHLCWPVF